MPDSSSGNAPDTHAAVDSAVLVSLDLDDSDSAENLEELRQLAASDRLAISAVVLGNMIQIIVRRPNGSVGSLKAFQIFNDLWKRCHFIR